MTQRTLDDTPELTQATQSAASPPQVALERAAHRNAVRRLDEATRVRLGASVTTSAETFGVLAVDPSVTVRAAVAMNPATPERAHRLLAQDSDERVRSLLARKLAALIPRLTLDERHALETRTLTLLTQLVQDEAVRVRAAIADVVKEMHGVPRELILRLAWDSALPVSEPVIRLSPLLSAEDLLALLAEPPTPGVAKAIAGRRGLAPSVSDVLAASVDCEAVGALLDNGSAAIREATLDALIARAQSNQDWQEKLVRRPTLSARAARALSEIVATQLLSTLASRGDLDPAITHELHQRLHERAGTPDTGDTQKPPRLEEALDRARALAEQGGLNEAAVLAAAQRGEARMCSAMLAVAAQVPVSVVERASTLRSTKGLVSLIWKAGFSMKVSGPLQVLLCRVGPDAVLRELARGGFPLAVDEMRWQLEFLQRAGR